MDRHLIGFLLVFLLLIAASLAFANTDQITPAVVEARSEIAMGTTTAQALGQGLTWIGKVILGGLFAGVAATVYTEGRKVYKAWLRNSQQRRWTPGPNAQWKDAAPGPKLPSLKREDLLLMALMGREMPANRMQARVSAKRAQGEDESLDMEF